MRNQKPHTVREMFVRQRLEWSTRSTINKRYVEMIADMGPKTVTPEDLRNHPSHGAQTMTPTASRKDERPYHGNGVSYFPDRKNPLERPRLPPKSLFQNPWLNSYDIESGDIARELRGSVKETNRYLTEDTGARFQARIFARSRM